MAFAAPSNCPPTLGPKPSLIGCTVRGKYFVESRIGRGNFGVVYKVIDLELSRRADGHIRRAMKVIDVADRNPPGTPPSSLINYQLNQAVREIHYHRLVSSHPNIVTLHEYFYISNREEMVLILDYCAGGDLWSYITARRNPFAGDDRRMREIILQICGAVDFMHSRGVFHKDLKPQNILISTDGRKVVLCDFGLASDIRSNTRGGGSTPYMSPELLAHKGFYCPRRADTWTLGIIVLNILGFQPWDSATTRSRRFCRFMRDDASLLGARQMSPEARKLIRDILRFHPELRLSVPEISARLLQLRSFFNNPHIKHTSAELEEMRLMYQCMLARSDPVARRRKELEYLWSLDGTSVFNDFSGRLPLPPPPPRIFVHNLPDNPLPQANGPHCTSIQGIPPPVALTSSEEHINVWWNMDTMQLGGGWYRS